MHWKIVAEQKYEEKLGCENTILREVPSLQILT